MSGVLNDARWTLTQAHRYGITGIDGPSVFAGGFGGRVEVVPAEQHRGAVEENRVLSRALSLACKGDRNPTALKDALLKQAGVDLFND